MVPTAEGEEAAIKLTEGKSRRRSHSRRGISRPRSWLLRPIGGLGCCALRVSAPRPAGAGQQAKAIEDVHAAIKAGQPAEGTGLPIPADAAGDGAMGTPTRYGWCQRLNATLQGFTRLLGKPVRTGCSVSEPSVEDQLKHAAAVTTPGRQHGSPPIPTNRSLEWLQPAITRKPVEVHGDA